MDSRRTQRRLLCREGRSDTHLGLLVPGVMITPVGALSSPAAMARCIRARNASSILEWVGFPLAIRSISVMRWNSSSLILPSREAYRRCSKISDRAIKALLSAIQSDECCTSSASKSDKRARTNKCSRWKGEQVSAARDRQLSANIKRRSLCALMARPLMRGTLGLIRTLAELN
jgi:hypothetical protein